jgi:hypothetical protein
MVEEDKSAKILLTGDTKTCSHCEADDKHFRDKLGPEKYEYIDVNTEKGQEKLREYGIKDGQKVDIPIIKVEACKTETDEKGEKHKTCKTKDWKEEMWKDIDNGQLPESVYID